jgi:acid phosphatase type 7
MRRLTRLLMFVLVCAASVVGLTVLPEAGAEVTTSVTVVANADASVSSAEAATNFGGESELRVDGAPNDNTGARTLRTYIRFQTPDVPPVSRAVLRLYATNGDNNGFSVRAVTPDWDETTITWSNAPEPAASPAVQAGAFAAGEWVAVDVSPLVQGGGAISFELTASGASPMTFASSEQGSAAAPQLSIDVAAAPPVNQTPPTISGRPEDGQTLTASAGTWSGSLPIAYAYQWKRCTADGTSCGDLAGETAPTHAVTAADVGATLRVAVTASNAVGSSSAASAPTGVVSGSSPSLDTAPPSAPAGLDATAAPTSLTLSWAASSDNVGVSGYSLYLGATKVATIAETRYTFSGLTCGTSYTLGVAADDVAGNQSSISTLTVATTACADTTAPGAPLGLSIRAADQTSLTLSWAASSDNVGVTGYRVYLGTSSVATTTSTSFTFTGLACGSSYTLGVEAYDAVGNTSPRTTLTTATAACSAGDFVVAAAGDVACAAPGTRGTATCHQQATADLIKSMNPSKVLMLGDAQYETGTLANFSGVYDPSWGAFKAKTLVTAGGSHDFYGGDEFFTYFGTTSMPRGAYKPYSYDLGSWHIVSMNSYCENANVGGCGTSGAEYTWLQADLLTNTKPCILAMWHEPYWTSGYRHNNDTVTRPYLDLLYLHGADVLLSGHEHAYESFYPQRPDGTRDDANGIRAFVVGTGGKSLETAWGTIEPNSAARQRDTFGVLKLTLHSSSYDWEFVPEAGKTYTDTGSGSCH